MKQAGYKVQEEATQDETGAAKQAAKVVDPPVAQREGEAQGAPRDAPVEEQARAAERIGKSSWSRVGEVQPDPVCENWPKKVLEVLQPYKCDPPMKFAFDRCAIVGGASTLEGRGKGAEIDAHDTVIRVNRIPTTQFQEDFGLRTDVLFAR